MKHSISSHATCRQKGNMKLCQSSSRTTQEMQYYSNPLSLTPTTQPKVSSQIAHCQLSGFKVWSKFTFQRVTSKAYILHLYHGRYLPT